MPKASSTAIESPTELRELIQMTTEELRVKWTRIFKHSMPLGSRREFILGALAYELQARAHGELKSASHRTLCAMAKDLARTGSLQATTQVIRPGAKLLRTWQGTLHEVLALEKGFSYQGRTYSSLSEIAREITGARWSGPLFFGLKTPRPKKPKSTAGEVH